MSNSSRQYVLGGEHIETPEEGSDRLPVTQMSIATQAANDPTLETVLKQVFDLGEREQIVYRVLLDCGPSTVGDLTAELDWERSRSSRGLKRLCNRGLATRRRRILNSGGHVYEYTARRPDAVTQLLLAGIDEWAESARQAAKRFGTGQ